MQKEGKAVLTEPRSFLWHREGQAHSLARGPSCPVTAPVARLKGRSYVTFINNNSSSSNNKNIY